MKYNKYIYMGSQICQCINYEGEKIESNMLVYYLFLIFIVSSELFF